MGLPLRRWIAFIVFSTTNYNIHPLDAQCCWMYFCLLFRHQNQQKNDLFVGMREEKTQNCLDHHQHMCAQVCTLLFWTKMRLRAECLWFTKTYKRQKHEMRRRYYYCSRWIKMIDRIGSHTLVVTNYYNQMLRHFKWN